MSLSDNTIQPIDVAVESTYQPVYSKPLEELYVFAYKIVITNHSSQPAKLLRRHWIVTDAAGQVREVEGEGVVGQQPTIGPGENYEYVSWIQLATPIGAMEGDFTMERPTKNGLGLAEFKAPIPRFTHVAPELFN
jgi:ApaG protein